MTWLLSQQLNRPGTTESGLFLTLRGSIDWRSHRITSTLVPRPVICGRYVLISALPRSRRTTVVAGVVDSSGRRCLRGTSRRATAHQECNVSAGARCTQVISERRHGVPKYGTNGLGHRDKVFVVGRTPGSGTKRPPLLTGATGLPRNGSGSSARAVVLGSASTTLRKVARQVKDDRGVDGLARSAHPTRVRRHTPD